MSDGKNGRGSGGFDLPASNNFREMLGAKAAALQSKGQSTRRTIRQNPPTVASHVTTVSRAGAVECEDEGLEEG